MLLHLVVLRAVNPVVHEASFPGRQQVHSGRNLRPYA
jgi:hypothetical protein